VARIQTPQHVQELQAEFKVREPFGLELLETIQPTYSLGRQKIASTGYPRKAMAVVSAGAGGVGTNIENIILCPSDVGIIVLLEEIWIENIGGRVTFRLTDGVAPATVSSTPNAARYRDGRLPGRAQATFAIANPLTAAPNGEFVSQVACLADDTKIFPFDVILGAGDYFLTRQSTANAGMTTTFLWTEFLLADR